MRRRPIPTRMFRLEALETRLAPCACCAPAAAADHSQSCAPPPAAALATAQAAQVHADHCAC